MLTYKHTGLHVFVATVLVISALGAPSAFADDDHDGPLAAISGDLDGGAERRPSLAAEAAAENMAVLVETGISPVAALRVAIGKFTNFSSAERTKAERALAVLETVVNSGEFQQAVLGFKYLGKLQYSLNQGLTNEEILKSIYNGAETYNRAVNSTIDLNIRIYNGNSTTIGYTYPSSSQININRRFFKKYKPSEIAGNFMHEWLHKLGYKHDSNRTTRRSYSVPYAIGYMVRDLGAKYN